MLHCTIPCVGAGGALICTGRLTRSWCRRWSLAISLGTELLFYRGQVPTDLPVDETIAALAGEVGFPLKYGYAAVGQVVASGRTGRSRVARPAGL